MTDLSAAIRQDRLWADIEALAAITEPGRPYMRRSFSPCFERGRQWLTARFGEAGLATRVDDAGNLIGRRRGSRQGSGTLMSGSHSDTVPDGGRFDGILGVLAALETARAYRDAGIVLQHDLEIVDFLAEEPSEFGLSCIGSRGMSGALTDAHRNLVAPWGETLSDAISRMGGRPEELDRPRRRDIRAFFELHIEQGIVLEQDNIQIGVVGAIAGVTRLEICFTGRADHAGTTPMDRRRDASLPAAALIGFVNAEARRLSQAGRGHVTATCGIMELLPGASNVVARSARLVVDVRVSERIVAETLVEAIREECGRVARESATTLARFAIQSDTHPVFCDTALTRLVEATARDNGLSARHMVSGAGHDAAFVARLAPVSMIFVPCRDGRSHDPEEWCTPEDATRGALALADAVLAADAAP